MDKPTIGIDLGGTKIGTGLVDAQGSVLSSDYRPTNGGEGQDAVIARLVEGVERTLSQVGMTIDGVSSIGLGAPGPMDLPRGVLTEPPNLPGWRDVPLRQIIEERIGLPAYIENDANAAGIGEYLYGAGRGTRNMVYVTVSTGIGGGLILDGQIYHGTSGGAGEIGHTIILPHGPRCPCGNRGCLEVLASGTAIAREGQELVDSGAHTLVSEIARGAAHGVTALHVVEAMNRGDAYAAEIVNQALYYLGLGMANLVNLFNPEMIVIGGGLSNLRDVLLSPVRRAIQRYAFSSPAEQVTVALAQLGAEVGIVGAAGAAILAARRSERT